MSNVETKILIFDLDKTIDAYVMKGEPLRKVKEILDRALKYGWYAYVVTARRLTAFDGNKEALLSYGVNREIVQKLKQLNTGVPYEYWLFYTEHDEEPDDYVNKLKVNPQFRTNYNNFVRKNKLDTGAFNFGLFKMMQIETICRLHKMHNPNFRYHNVFFFDDNRHNYKAWVFTYTDCIPELYKCNSNIQHMHFIGGRDLPVFGSTLTPAEYKEVIRVRPKINSHQLSWPKLNFNLNNSPHRKVIGFSRY